MTTERAPWVSPWVRQLVLVGLVLALPQGSADHLAIRQSAGGEISRFNISTQQSSAIYKSTWGGIGVIKIAPSERWVGVIEHQVAGEYKTRLVILDASGTVVRTVEREARRFEWCCGGEGVVFVAGSFAEAGLDFHPSGVYLMHVSTGVVTRVDAPADAYEIHWAAFDSSLYIKTISTTPHVYRYQPSVNKAVATAYSDVLFSPSGHHYLRYVLLPEDGRIGWHLIERVTGRDMPLPDSTLGTIEGWAFSEGDYLRLVRRTPRVGPRDRLPAKVGLSTGGEFDGYTFFDVSRWSPVGTVPAAQALQGVTTAQGFFPIRDPAGVRLIRLPAELRR